MNKTNKKDITSTIGISDELINKIIIDLDRINNEKVILNILNMHPADTADLIEKLSSEYRKKIIKILGNKFPSDALASMNVPVLITIIDLFSLFL